jgi:hypothetical protein
VFCDQVLSRLAWTGRHAPAFPTSGARSTAEANDEELRIVRNKM